MDPLEPIERTEPTDVQRPAPQVTSFPRRSKAPKVLGVLLVLALIGCGVLGWMVYDQNGQKSSLSNKVAAKDDQIDTIKAELKSLKANTGDSNNSTESKSESNPVVDVALAYAQADVGNAANKLSAQVMYNKDGFANVAISVTGGAGGTGEILKKVNDQWVVVFSGQDNPPQEVVTAYGIPKAALLLTN
jgi:cell division protein FtsB